RLLDVRVDGIALLVVHGPARPPRQRELRDHAQRVEIDDRSSAALTHWLAQVEAVQPPPLGVEGEPVWVRPHVDPADQLLTRTAKDTDSVGGAVAGEEQVVLLVNQHAGYARQVGERAQMRSLLAVEHVDSISTRVRDVHAAAGPEYV